MKVGIIGAGAIVRRAHLPAWKKLAEIQVTAISDINELTAKKVAREFAIPVYTNNYLEIIEESSIEIIDVATPTPSHFEIVFKAIEKGKHILVEKPLTLKLEEAIAIYKMAYQKNLKITVIYNYRYYPAVIKAKQRLESGKLGRLISINGLALSRFPVSWTRSTWLYHSGGALYDFGPHLIDLILWLNNSNPVEVASFGGDISNGQMGFITHAQLMIKFEDGSVAQADISWLTGSNIFQLSLHGTGGHIILDVRGNSLLEFHGTFTPLDNYRRFCNEIKGLWQLIRQGSFFLGPIYYYFPLFEDFINSIKRNCAPPISLDHALKINLILYAAEKSIQSGKIIQLKDIFQVT